MNLYVLAALAAARSPNASAIVDESGVTTFRELVRRADDFAGWLRAAPPGTVGLLGRNSAGFVAALLGAERAGRRTVLLNTTFSPAQVRDTCAAHGVALLVEDFEDFGVRGSGRGCSAGLPHLGPSRLAVLTSGSTGPPKIVRRRVRLSEAWRTAALLPRTLQVRPGAPTLLTVPLFHGHGLATLTLCLAFGAPLHVFARGTAEAYWQALRAGTEVLVLVPTVLHRLLELPGEAPRLRTIVSGSAPLGPDLARRALTRFGPILFNLYGASEAGLISLATPHLLLAAPESVGRPLPGVRVVLRNGEVTANGVSTGDLGALNPSGLLTLRGRADDVLVVGGENVVPEHVEARLAALPGVREAAVAGVPSAEYGTALAAFVVLEAGATLEALTFEAWPRMLRPVEVRAVDALPRNAAGKLVRRSLRELAQEWALQELRTSRNPT